MNILPALRRPRHGDGLTLLNFARSPRCAVIVGALALATLASPAVRADAPAAPSVDDRLDKLEAKLGALERENQALHQQLGDVSAQIDSSAKTKYPEIRLNVLGDIDYTFNNIKNDPHGTTLGDIDLVTTARLNEQATVTSDYVVSSDQGEFHYEIERLFVSYKFNDAFNLDLGRFHAAMGWYNNFYHNGTYFQTTRERPLVYDFEDNGGILPVHATGLSLNGNIPSGSANLSYSFEVTNGRKYTADTTHALQIEDDNNFKAFNLQLRAKPEGLQYWTLGVGAYHDTLTPVLDPVNAPDTTTRVDQFIFTAFAIYKSPVIEWFTETALVGDEPVHAQRRWTFAGYTQLSHKFGKIRPYLRLEWMNANLQDPVLGLIGQNDKWWVTQIGLRYDFTTMMAWKVEYEHTQPKTAPTAEEFSSQVSFRF